MRAGVLLWGLSLLARLFLCSFLWHLHLFGSRCPFGIGHHSDWVRAALTAPFKSITPAKAPLPNTVTFQGGKCAKRKLWSTHSPVASAVAAWASQHRPPTAPQPHLHFGWGDSHGMCSGSQAFSPQPLLSGLPITSAPRPSVSALFFTPRSRSMSVKLRRPLGTV